MESRIEAIEKDLSRHEATIELLRGQLTAIHESVVRIETQLALRPVPGGSEFCRRHMELIDGLVSRVDELEKDTEQIKMRIAAWVGGAVAVLTIINFMEPTIRAFLHIQ